MNWLRAVLLGSAVVLGGCASLLSVWIQLPLPGIAALILLSGCIVADTWLSDRQRTSYGAPGVWICAVCVVIIAAALLFAARRAFTFDAYYGVLFACIAGLLFLPSRTSAGTAMGKQWKILGLISGFCAVCLWVAASYANNIPISFHLGLAALLVLLVLAKVWFRMPLAAVQVANTLILLVIGLPILDLFIRPSYRLNLDPKTARSYFSYDAAKKNPVAFRRWWNFYLDQWTKMGKAVFLPDPEGFYPFRLRPGSHGMLFQSRIEINHQGFRGKEFEPEKKPGTYRIFALGESTTFGCTLNANDRTWPDLLEEMINERLRPTRAVEVINAGVPSYHLHHNNHRLITELLQLKPDMIISYHGYNGFTMLYGNLPPVFEKNPPAYHGRPLKILADCEYRLRMMHYEKQKFAKVKQAPPPIPNPMETEYAREYRQLINTTRSNHCRLAIANFSMAANGQSPIELLEFYREPFRAIQWQIKANEVLSGITKRLAEENPEVCWVDTHPGLDGNHDMFIDLVHFTQPGRQQLAENIFAGIKPLLEQELNNPPKKLNAAPN